MAWAPVVSDDFMLTFWEVLARGENCTDVRLARRVAAVQNTGLDVHDISLCQRECRCSRL